MPIDLKELFDELKTGIAGIAKASFSKFTKEAKADGEALLKSMKEKLERWTKMLVDQTLTPDEFGFLVKSQKDIVQLSALHQAGLTLVRIDQFKSAVLNLVIDTVFKAVKI